MPQHTLAPPLDLASDPPIERFDLGACCGQYTYDGHHLGVSLRDRAPLARAEVLRDMRRRPDPGWSDRIQFLLSAWEDEYNDRLYEDDDEDESRSSEPVLDYSYKPRWKFHPELEPSPDNVFMGMEMEVECTGSYGDAGDGAAFARDTLYDPEPEYHGFLKVDASLNNGFEIVTQPMTYQHGIAHWPWQLLDTLHNEHGFRARDNAGIHIHVARKSFTSPGHVYRWLTFLHRNPEPIQAIARRGSVNYASWDGGFRSEAVKYAKGARDSSRYVAVNTQNADTFEARFFRSTLRTQSAQAALGLIDSTVAYTRNLDVPSIVKDSGWGWQAYASWLTSEGQWKPLQAEIEERVKPLPDYGQSVRPRQQGYRDRSECNIDHTDGYCRMRHGSFHTQPNPF